MWVEVPPGTSSPSSVWPLSVTRTLRAVVDGPNPYPQMSMTRPARETRMIEGPATKSPVYGGVTTPAAVRTQIKMGLCALAGASPPGTRGPHPPGDHGSPTTIGERLVPFRPPGRTSVAGDDLRDQEQVESHPSVRLRQLMVWGRPREAGWLPLLLLQIRAKAELSRLVGARGLGHANRPAPPVATGPSLGGDFTAHWLLRF